MIVELFGPPCAGKTSFCHMLAAQLRQDGHRVELWLSQRPAEPSRLGMAAGGRSTAAATMLRFARPLAELVTIARAPMACMASLRTAADLLHGLPQPSRLRALRVQQYVLRLGAAWARAVQGDGIAIFDQAFVQMVFSLACTGRVAGAAALDTALDVIPRSDILVGLDAPMAVLRDRLQERLGRQGPIERVLERATRYGPADKVVHDRLLDCLRRRDQPVFAVETCDAPATRAATAAILTEIAVRLKRRRADGCDGIVAGSIGLVMDEASVAHR